MVELSTPVKVWINRNWQSKGCRFNSCPFHCFLILAHALLRKALDFSLHDSLNWTKL